MGKWINITIKKFKEAFVNASNGDFTEKLEIKSKDEFKELSDRFNTMKDEIRKVIQGIKAGSEKVLLKANNLSNIIIETSQSIEGVSRSTEELARGSTNLAKDAQVGSENLERLSEEIENLANSTKLMENYISETSKANKDGADYIIKLKDIVDTTNKMNRKFANQVNILDDKSGSISKIMEAIKSITSQINLLSLNAAIEAARAGEHGKGFAVVASEIGKLASQTDSSTKEIENIITEITHEIDATKSQISEIESVIEQADKASLGTTEAFEKVERTVSIIIKNIEILTKNIESINKDKKYVVDTISNVSAVVEESASTTEEISASMQEQNIRIEEVAVFSEDLKKIAKELEELISKFKI